MVAVINKFFCRFPPKRSFFCCALEFPLLCDHSLIEIEPSRLCPVSFRFSSQILPSGRRWGFLGSGWRPLLPACHDLIFSFAVCYCVYRKQRNSHVPAVEQHALFGAESRSSGRFGHLVRNGRPFITATAASDCRDDSAPQTGINGDDESLLRMGNVFK